MPGKVTGKARLDGNQLRITVQRQKGARTESYTVIRLHPHPAVAYQGLRLRKADGSSYDVHEDAYGINCDCPDFQARRAGTGLVCKHIAALHAVGLLRVEP